MPDETPTNGYNADELKTYLDAIDSEDQKLRELHSEYMLKCKGPRGKIRETLASAKEAGINMTAFRLVLEKHRLERKHERHVADLEADDADSYERILEALGSYADTPLGTAALDRAKGDQVLDTLSH